MMDFKDIHIGQLIENLITESGIEMSRICNFMGCSEDEISKMYTLRSLDSCVLLGWSKLLEYDFFRIYSQHLILFAPKGNGHLQSVKQDKRSAVPHFRKNIYTREMIQFVLEQLKSGEMSRNKIITEYRIPKTTLYKWIQKYNVSEENKNK